MSKTFYEFFAGGGMARAGLVGWDCLFANDFDPAKAASYERNWGGDHLQCGDIANVLTADLPGLADLAWASFPCQDLSLAGDYRGLGSLEGMRRTRSGTFWTFWKLMEALASEGRAPRTIVLENVLGFLTSNGGRDFAAVSDALVSAGYMFGAVVIDAKDFLPQSRPRVFLIAVKAGTLVVPSIRSDGPSPDTSRAIVAAFARLSPNAQRNWIWWKLDAPPQVPCQFSEVVEDQPEAALWHQPQATQRLLDSMSPINRAKVDDASRLGGRVVGTLYRRTRPDDTGSRRVRAEVRFDGVAGCLRTPAGGSSRQQVLVVEGAAVRSRLLSPREAARLMGLPDTYILPARYNEAYHLLGDGVAVPVVQHLARCILEPLIAASAHSRMAAE